MKTIIALVLVVASLTLTGCASTSTFTSACEQSIVPQQKVVGVNGVPASVVKGSIKAVNVELPSDLESPAAVSSAMKADGLDYLLVVKVDEKNEIRTDGGAMAKKAGLFMLSLAASAITRNAVNLDRTSGTPGQVVKVVTTTMSIYSVDGKLVRTKTTVKEMSPSEAIPAAEVAAQVVAGCMSQG